MTLHRLLGLACTVFVAILLTSGCGEGDEASSPTDGGDEAGDSEAATARVEAIRSAVESCAASSGAGAYVSPEIDCTAAETLVEADSALGEATFTTDQPAPGEYEVRSLNGGQGYIVQTAVELDSQTVYFAQLAPSTSGSFGLCGPEPFDERSSVDSGGSNLPGCPDGTWSQ